MRTSHRRTRIAAGHRSRYDKALVAILATVALTIGPGALTAFADDSSTAAVAPAPELVTEAAPAPDAVEEPASEVPADPVVEPAPDPAIEPATQPPADSAESAQAPATDVPAPAALGAPSSERTENGGDDHCYEPDAKPLAAPGSDSRATTQGDGWDDCEPDKQPYIDMTPPACVPFGTPAPAMVVVSLSNLTPGANYTIELVQGDWNQSFSAPAPLPSVDLPIPLNGFGMYTASIYGPGQLSDSVEFSIWQCDEPPPVETVSFCHAVTDYPEVAKVASFADFLYYEFLTLPKDEILDGHAGVHPDDIIPPFSYFDGEGTAEFLGQNWDEYGQMLLRNDCEERTPVPVLSVDIMQCTGPNGVVPSTVLVTIGSLVVDDDYTLRLTGPMGLDESTPFTATAETMEFEQAINGPGDFVAEVSSGSEDPVMDMHAFTVNPQCAVKTPPVVTTSTPKPPVLVSTGVAGDGPHLAATILLLSGGTLLGTAGVRRVTRSCSSPRNA